PYSVVIGARSLDLDGQDEAAANVKDISVDDFSVSVCGKELMTNVSLKVSHGSRYFKK
ncbi:hypothetical protein Tco_0574762, partial [Tanacetum coccineum]